MEAISSASIAKCTEFASQLISNTSWAFASLEVVDLPLLDSLAASAIATITDSRMEQAAQALLQLVLDMTAVAWAFAYVRCLGDVLLRAIHGLAVRSGQELDRRMSTGKRGSGQVLPPTCSNGASNLPRVELNLRGEIVLFKPAAWEVNGRGSLVLEEEAGDGRLGLSTFVQALFPKEQFPLPHRPDLDHGFLHRLDVPSSGLVLAATTVEGYHSLRLQLNTYALRREYLVLCQGAIPPALGTVSLGIGSTAVRVQRSTADVRGKPAQTYVGLLSHLAVPRPPGRAECAAVAIRIRTGRHHQIRTHMLHSAHPTVADAKYTVWDLLVR